MKCDFLVDLAAELPMQAICLLLGVPEEDRHLLFEAVEHIFDLPDESDYLAMTPSAARRWRAVRLRRGTHRGKAADPARHAVGVVHAELPDEDPPP